MSVLDTVTSFGLGPALEAKSDGHRKHPDPDPEEMVLVTILEAPSSPSASSLSSRSSHSNAVDVDDPLPSMPPASTTTSAQIPTPVLADEQLWEPWFAFPSRPHMTLHRWAEGQKSQLQMHMHHTHFSPPSTPLSSPLTLSTTQAQYTKLLGLSRSTLASLKILVIGSILLIRGVQHGPQMGRTLFGRMLGDRYNDLMAFGRGAGADGGELGCGVEPQSRSKSRAQARSRSRSNAKDEADSTSTPATGTDMWRDETKIRLAVEEARALQLRGNEFFAMGKYDASLEHYGLGIIRLIPWDVASLPPHLARRTGFLETGSDQALLLSIALTSVRLTQSLPPHYRRQDTLPGSRLYRLTMASCDYVRCSPVPARQPRAGHSVGAGARAGAGGEDEELHIVQRLEELARDIAGIPPSPESPEGAETSPRDLRRELELALTQFYSD